MANLLAVFMAKTQSERSTASGRAILLDLKGDWSAHQQQSVSPPSWWISWSRCLSKLISISSLSNKLVSKLVKVLVQAGGQLLRQRSRKTMTGLTSCTSSAGRSSNCLTDSFSICWGGINWSAAAGSALISTGQSISNAVSALSWPFRITIMLFWIGFGCGVGVPW